VGKSYQQYCPIAHALDLVGERWSLLVVRELLHEGPLRYSDLHARLDGCGTNILAARLKALEQGGVVRRRRLDPPAASWVYELTEYGEGLQAVLHVLAHWGARSLRPPASEGDLEAGWLPGALRIALPARVAGSYWTALGEITFEQRFQFLTGALRAGGNSFALQGRVRGEEITFTVAYPTGGRRLSARVNGRSLELR